MLLGRPMVARQGKGCRWRGAEEGHVDNPLYAGVDRRVDEGEVLLKPFGRLGGGHHEDGMGPSQRRSDRGAATVIGSGDVGSGQGRRLRGIAYHEALVDAQLGESTGYPRTETTGRARYSEGGLCSDHDGFTPLTINRELAKPAQSTGFHRPLNGHSAGTHWSRSDDSLAVRRAYH